MTNGRPSAQVRAIRILGASALVVLAVLIILLVLLNRPLARTVEPDAAAQRITVGDAKALLERGEALLYDVRSRAAYDASHAAGAVALPEAELASLVDTLPTDKTLILYCT